MTFFVSGSILIINTNIYQSNIIQGRDPNPTIAMLEAATRIPLRHWNKTKIATFRKIV
mgnify:CR=1 FL=1